MCSLLLSLYTLWWPSVLKIMNNSNWLATSDWNCFGAYGCLLLLLLCNSQPYIQLYQELAQQNSLIGKIVFSWCCFLVYSAPYRKLCIHNHNSKYAERARQNETGNANWEWQSIEAYFTFHFTHQLQAENKYLNWQRVCVSQATVERVFIERECRLLYYCHAMPI